MKRRAWRRWYLLLLILPLWFVSWIAARNLIVEAPLASADAILVLAGSADYRERTERAAQLYADKRAPLIILTNDNQISGWSNVEERNPFYYERARNELIADGVPLANIHVLQQAVTSTHEEALLLRAHAEQNGLKSVLIVTSPYHSRRALWTMRRVLGGTNVIVGLETSSFAQSPQPATWWLSWRGWKAVPWEYAKLVYYRLRY